ncbi:MAG: hypothetical protein K0U59_03235 [Gammaproteobacteria bacterium]|nr:hypothetical protein [Gammaproteobacteria bacterium]
MPKGTNSSSRYRGSAAAAARRLWLLKREGFATGHKKLSQKVRRGL